MRRPVPPVRRPVRRPLRRPAGPAPRRTYRPRRPTSLAATRSAAAQLRRFRQGSVLVVSITALILLVWGVPESRGQPAADTDAPSDTDVGLPSDPTEAVTQATTTLRDLLYGFYGMMPKVLIAVAVLALAAVLTRLVRALLQRTLGDWDHANALSAMVAVVTWLIALGVALSVLAGNASALLGSVGLAGLALSWALQAPIESFSGWLLNSFRGYYRIGDRIAVGEVFGDVYAIDVLTTTVWEAGGPGKAVQGAQSTGALVTFPNSEVLRANIVNYTRLFPYVWDEVTVGVAEECDLALVERVAKQVADDLLGENMAAPTAHYAALLQRARLSWDVATEAQVYISPGDFWANVTVRYVVPARERRKWASALYVALGVAFGEHGDKIRPAYVRERPMFF